LRVRADDEAEARALALKDMEQAAIEEREMAEAVGAKTGGHDYDVDMLALIDEDIEQTDPIIVVDSGGNG
jgi:hypothetical protein